MTPTDPGDAPRYEQAKALFLLALELPRAGRFAFVEERCGADAALRGEVLHLLQLHGESDSVLDQPLEADRAFEPADEPPGRLIGPYRVLRPLGRGGMGVVYLAQRDDAPPVALKLLATGLPSAGTRERFRREAAILARLDHPGVARLLEAGEAEGGPAARPWIAMEYVEGEPLLAFATARGLSVRDRIELLATVCDAVAHSHALGIVHRDLKPDNILVRDDGRPVVLDFGVARLLEDGAPASPRMTQTGVLVGTPQYMSPEQVQAEPATVGPPSDVYSLGVIAFELLGGRLPYEAGAASLHRAVVAVLTAEPPPLGSLAGELRGPIERVVAKALEKRPADRYADAAELADDLRRWLGRRTVRARGPGAMRRVMRWSRRRRAAAAAFALAAAAVAFAATWWVASGGLDRRGVDAAYVESEVDLFRSTSLVYEGERTAPRLREAIAMLAAARERIRGLPKRSHRERLDRALLEHLGTAEFLLGGLEWDSAAYRSALIHLEEALHRRLDEPGWERDLRTPQILVTLGERGDAATWSLLAGAQAGLGDLWGEYGMVYGPVNSGWRALEETRRAFGPPKPAAALRLPDDHNEPYFYRYNDLAEAFARAARYSGRPDLALEALHYSDSAIVRREVVRLNLPAFGSVLFQRGNAWLACAEIRGEPAAADSALAWFRLALEHRGPSRPLVHAETRSAMAQAELAAAAWAPNATVARARVGRALEDVRLALAPLPASLHPGERARLRSLEADALVQEAIVTRDPRPLAAAAARVDSNSAVFNFLELPRYFALDQVRLASIERARVLVSGDTNGVAGARARLANALDRVTVQKDSTAIRRIVAESAALAAVLRR